MQKLMFKGLLKELDLESVPLKTKEGTMRKAVVIEPAYTDQFGDKVGQDQIFEVIFFNEKIKGIDPALSGLIMKRNQAIAANEKPEQIKVEVVAFLNGSEKASDKDGTIFYNVMISGMELKLLVKK